MLPWPPELRQAFLRLAPQAAVGGALCRAVADDRFAGTVRLRDICATAGLAESRSKAVEQVLTVGEELGLFVQRSGIEWAPAADPRFFATLATALEAASLYREQVHVDADQVEIVLTPPGNPSRLRDALRQRGWAEADMEHTEAILLHLAHQATVRLVVMSPFIDAGGAANLLALFRATPGTVRRVLITRCPDGGVPAALMPLLQQFAELNVAIHSYWLPRPGGGYETGHAKVVLSDDRAAYVGSANMTQASLSISMELGAFLRGASVTTLVSVIDAILSIAPKIN